LIISICKECRIVYQILTFLTTSILATFAFEMRQGETYSLLIKQMATKYGFDYCGIAKAQPLDDDARRLEIWLNQGMHGGMKYMENYFDLRIDPSRLVPGAKSVITLMKNYFPGTGIHSPEQEAEACVLPKISKYAWGKDYHEVIRAKLKTMIGDLQQQIGAFSGRGFVDSAPVLERSWAQRAGLGWIGRNGNLITKQSGSFFFYCNTYSRC
jgi:epoxyqueuosine reductase